MDYFRADKREFAEGERIASAFEYRDKLGDLAKRIEDELERLRPFTKPPRQSCLFLFEDESAARTHWSRMTNGKLYRVSIEASKVLHRADMALLDVMKNSARDARDIADLAGSYWRGELGDSPVIEVMVDEATVTEIVATSEDERLAYLRQRLRL